MRPRWADRLRRRLDPDPWFDAVFLLAWFALAFGLGYVTAIPPPIPAPVAAPVHEAPAPRSP